MRKPKPPRLVTIAILTTLTIILWIFFGVYRILTSKPPTVVPEDLLAPIDATLDKEALENIEARVFFEEDEIPETLEVTILTEIPTEEEITPSATPSAEPIEETPELDLSPTPTATQSASGET
ncbi:hypothetical protein IID22_01685 [Patescibacteria group bacterium]|nr:hypothetical protein [Patescibacteria group bacterium]